MSMPSRTLKLVLWEGTEDEEAFKIRSLNNRPYVLAYSELCKSDNTPCFRQEEIDKVCQTIINSPVDTSRELQDRVLNILQNNSY